MCAGDAQTFWSVTLCHRRFAVRRSTVCRHPHPQRRTHNTRTAMRIDTHYCHITCFHSLSASSQSVRGRLNDFNFDRMYSTLRRGADAAKSGARRTHRGFSTFFSNIGSKYSEKLESHPFTTQMVTSGILGQNTKRTQTKPRQANSNGGALTKSKQE